MNGPWGSVLTAMVTPFDDDGALDLDAAATLARWLADHGNDGLVVAGTTGEAPSSPTTRSSTSGARSPRPSTIPVVAGTGTNDTAHSVQLTRRRRSSASPACSPSCPYYNRPSQAGIEAHLRAVAAATDLPVMIYDIPSAPAARSPRRARPARPRRAQRPRLQGRRRQPGRDGPPVAEAPTASRSTAATTRMTLPLLAVGAVGVVGVATHWAAPDRRDARRLRQGRRRCGPARSTRGCSSRYAFETSDECAEPAAAKAMLRELGLPVGECRLPMGPAPAGTEDRARERLRAACTLGRTDACSRPVTFLGGLGEIGRNCAARGRGPASCSSTAASCSPTPTCSASTSCCPTSRSCARTPDRIDGCVATHGHEDHVGGLSYLLRELQLPDLRLGAHARPGPPPHRGGGPARPHRARPGAPTASGAAIGPFDVEFIPVTHSVPHGYAIAFHTPQGTILHSGDFKLDLTPVDGRLTDLARIGADRQDRRHPAADVRLDQRRGARPRAERDGRSAPCCSTCSTPTRAGAIITASFASHIHRIQQIADAAIAFDRVSPRSGCR